MSPKLIGGSRLRVSVSVDAVGGRIAAGGIVSMPLESLTKTILPEGSDPTRLLGVKVVNKGAAGIDVTSAGIQLDVGLPDTVLPAWIFDGPWCRQAFPFRLEGRAREDWYVTAGTVRATVVELAKKTGRAPVRFRPFTDLGDDTWEVGTWRNAIELPIWKEGVAEDYLESLNSA